MMSGYQVKFMTQSDPNQKGGFILRYDRVGKLSEDISPLTVIFEDKVKLEGAFLKAGIYLHSFCKEDTGWEVMPVPDQNYEVNDAMMRDLGFIFPA
jgi:hypothetical protein